MTTISAVIFDLDGTLLDTLDDIAAATNHTLGAMGYPLRTTAEIADFVGEGVEALIRDALPESERNLATIQRCLAVFRPYYATHMTDHTRPYANIPALLIALASQRIPLAVLSNKPHEATTYLVNRVLDMTEFVVVRGSQTDVPKKPDPAAAIAIAKQIGVPAERIALIGDTAIDIQTAIAAGMHPVGVSWGFRPRELVPSGAAIVIDRPLQLMQHSAIQFLSARQGML